MASFESHDQSGFDHWTVYHLGATGSAVEPLLSVTGELKAISDNSLAVREKDTIRIESISGAGLGSVKVKPETKCATDVEIPDDSRLYLRSCERERMTDHNGKELVKLRAPDGWGFRHGWSADGRRLLYDHYVRTIPVAQSVGEVILAAVTLGIGAADEIPNGEAIRVVDTVSGGVCFDWKDLKHLIGEGEFHADISPSGKLVAMIAGGTLFVYRLPDTCNKN